MTITPADVLEIAAATLIPLAALSIAAGLVMAWVTRKRR